MEQKDITQYYKKYKPVLTKIPESQEELSNICFMDLSEAFL